MKHFFTYILAAVVLLCGCSKDEYGTFVNLSSSGPDFLNSEANLILSLTKRLDFPVTANLDMRGGNIPANHISFDKVVTIPAGEKDIAVTVTIIGIDELNAGDYEATFSISAVSGANLNSEKNSTTLHLKIDAKPTQTNLQ